MTSFFFKTAVCDTTSGAVVSQELVTASWRSLDGTVYQNEMHD